MWRGDAVFMVSTTGVDAVSRDLGSGPMAPTWLAAAALASVSREAGVGHNPRSEAEKSGEEKMVAADGGRRGKRRLMRRFILTRLGLQEAPTILGVRARNGIGGGRCGGACTDS